jgi:peptidoglycan/LPS O-acetylase OafA/YrhL
VAGGQVHTDVVGGSGALAALPRLGYRPELDGLRAIAVAVVIAYHAEIPGFSGGHVGVIWFFVLSGFLITTLLLEERSSIGDVDLVRFYQRRVLRLLPSLYLMLAVFGILAATILVIDWRDFASAGLYFSNMHPLVFGAGALNIYFLHTWSLSLEEQFYLVWPLVLRRSWPTWVAASGAGFLIVAAFVSRYFDHETTPILTLPIFSMDAFVIGALLALVLRGGKLPAWVMSIWFVGLAAGVMAVDVVVSHDTVGGFAPVRMLISQLAVAVAIAFLVTDRDHLSAAVLRSRPFVYVGLLSYALYLWHYPIFIALTAERQPDMPDLLRHGLKYSLTAVAAVATYHLLERPLGRRRSRLRPRDPRLPSAT